MSDELFEWRQRVLDSISPSFCAAKWLNSSIHLGHGFTHSCHLPIPHPIDKVELENNPSAIHNTKHKKIQRQKMLTGERPAECEYCWKIEDIGRKNISDRVYKSQIYTEEEITAISNIDPNEDVIPKTLEISFDRICNLACSYCNSGYSTTWGNDIKKNGPYQYMKSDGAGAYHHSGEWAEPYGKFNVGNPYVKAFFDWWPELSKELKEIRITGGEPAMSHQFWKFCDIVKNTNSPNLRMAVNSNLCIKDDILSKLIDFTHSSGLKEFDLYTSCEAVGSQAEYIRDGLDYKLWKTNLEKFIQEANFRSVTIMMTITSLSLFSITDFLDDMILLKEKYGHHRPHVDLNILRWPSFMSPLVLPEHIRTFCKDNLERWFDANKNNPSLVAGEQAQIKRLIDYLDTVKTPHRRADVETDKLHNDFKSFYQQYDERRNKDFENTFPEIIVDWYKSIIVDRNIPLVKASSGEIKNYEV